jgi:aspartate/methionine/tyrosine aminotransferase
VEPGDEVVFMLPNYMQINGLAEAFGAKVKPLWLREKLGWGIDADDLKNLVTPKTRVISVCNPNNPTGSVMSQAERDAIVAAASNVGAWIFADEVYRGAELDGAITPSFWGEYDRLLAMGGLSKAFSLPGLRTGWIIGPPKWIEKLWGAHDYTSIGPSLLTDRLASIAMEPRRRDWILSRTLQILRRNYPPLRAWLEARSDYFSHQPPKAGAIAWAGLVNRGNSRQMAEDLREKKGVLLVPGEPLGMESFVRFGYGGDSDQLQKALARIDEWIAENKRPRAAGAIVS